MVWLSYLAEFLATWQQCTLLYLPGALCGRGGGGGRGGVSMVRGVCGGGGGPFSAVMPPSHTQPEKSLLNYS